MSLAEKMCERAQRIRAIQEAGKIEAHEKCADICKQIEALANKGHFEGVFFLDVATAARSATKRKFRQEVLQLLREEGFFATLHTEDATGNSFLIRWSQEDLN